ncbi:MAG: gamma-glutamyltransferase [Kineosporiaceae bacterium]|nr:gamma-glutamyltransferase [Aeromicrobium sp.]
MTIALIRRGSALLATAALITTAAFVLPSSATPTKDSQTGSPQATARGTGGAVSSVDANASRVGREVLRKGGNATDAAVAMASTLGVTEPYSAGIGGGGYFVHYDAKTGNVETIDGRETAPAAMPNDAFIDPNTGKPFKFTPELVTSGVSVGVPGTLATWQEALNKWGSLSLDKALKPSSELARKGFVVDKTFNGQTADNAKRFAAFPSTSKLYLSSGQPAVVGSVQRNPDLANTLDLIRKHGTKAFYRGAIADEIAKTVQEPPKSADTTLPVPKGFMTAKDIADYAVKDQAATKVNYRGLDVYGMAPSSSGGTTVGESLNILENYRLSGADMARTLHLYLEASALAFADRGAYVGDPAYADVPTKTLLSQKFADSRGCKIDPTKASTKPLAAGALDGDGCSTAAHEEKPDTENVSTTHLSVVDKWGNAVAYTLTIEQTGGSGMVVPGRGFLLNNELTDFTAVYDAKDPNRIQPGKRPRSSMSPTIVTKDGKVKLVVGSPGGSTIITTVLQILVNRFDAGMSLPQAIAAPRASQRNTVSVSAEPEFITMFKDALAPYGHTLVPSGDQFTSAAEIGAAAGIEVDAQGRMTAAAEPVRRGGGTAEVVCPIDQKRNCR